MRLRYERHLLYSDGMRRFLEWPPTPPEVADWYGFPQMLNGAGQRIALIELAGGCREEDLRACYNRYGVCMPAISFVSVDGAKNDPTGDPFDRDDREVLLDLVVAGSLAPGAHLVVYFAPNTDCGLLNAITTAVHDDMLRPSVISISWGGAEPSWRADALEAINGALREATLRDITVLCSSGDFGRAGSIYDDGIAKVRFPASSPFVTACGGTGFNSTPEGFGETAWTAGWGSSGGGWSTVFAAPEWQREAVPAFAGGRGRGVPDVAAYAHPGYTIQVHGMWVIEGGTSGAAPLWAALCARINQAMGRPIGFLNPILYRDLAGSDALRPIAAINDADFAKSLWNPATGLGCPHGDALLKRLCRR